MWRLRAWRYRVAHRIERSFARCVPGWLRYWIVIDEAAKVSCAPPYPEVPTITWDQMAHRLGDR
jgi:hypothetical protein